MTFKQGSVAPSGDDARGKVVVKVYLQDPKLNKGFPVKGNRKYEVALDDATVGEVEEAIKNALFADGK